MWSFSYKKLSNIRIAVFFITLILLAGAVYKLFLSTEKIIYVTKAGQYYKGAHMVLAEDFYKKADGIGRFDYYNSLTTARLEELKPISELKDTVGGLSRELKEAARLNDISRLLEPYNKYEAMKQDASDSAGEAATYKELDDFFNIEADASAFFNDVKKKAERQAGNNIYRKNFEDEGFIQDMTAIPSEFLGGDAGKKEYVSTFVNNYEKSKFDIIAKNNDFSSVLTDTGKTIAMENGLGIDCSWLYDKLESYAKTAIENDISSGDYDKFASHAKSYGDFAANYLAGKDTEVMKMITGKTESDLAEAQKQLDAGNYAEALKIYEGIGKYKDMGDKIKIAESKWMESDPVQILSRKYPGLKFENTKSGKDRWDASIYVIASTKSEGVTKIFLGRLVNASARTETQITEYEALKDGTGIDSLDVNDSLEAGSPVIIASAPSKSRKKTFIGLAVQDGKFKDLFRFEADAASVASQGTLAVENPDANGMGGSCYLIKKGDTYSFSAYLEVRATDITKYKNQLVKFSCNVIAESNQGMVATDINNTNFYILLTGSKLPGTGRCTVTGRYTGIASVQKGFNTIDMPKVVLSSN